MLKKGIHNLTFYENKGKKRVEIEPEDVTAEDFDKAYEIFTWCLISVVNVADYMNGINKWMEEEMAKQQQNIKEYGKVF